MSHYSSERVVISQTIEGENSQILINETEGSGSIVNVTTTSKTLSRPSSYRKSYGVDTGLDLKGVRLGERQQLTKLNYSLGSYIDRVHELESLVKKLTAENNKLRKKCKKGVVEVDFSAIYSDDLRNLRDKLVQLKSKNVELQVERDNKAFDIEEILHKLGNIESKILVYKKEIEDLKKDLDDVSIDKTRLLAKISTLESQIKLEAGLHETELQNLRAQLSVESKLVFETDGDKPSILPDLTSIIANVRKEYEAFNAKNLSHLDNYYKEKVNSLTTQLRNLQSKVKNVKEDNAVKQRELAKIELELGPLKQKRLALEKHIGNLESRMVSMDKDQQHEIDNLRLRISSSKTELNKYLKKYQELNAIKLSLDKEISIYKKLITGERTRILSYRRRSHSSSSSSSSSDDYSSSSSDSQTSSETDTESELSIGWLTSDGNESSDSDVSTDDDVCSRSEDEGDSCNENESGISIEEKQLRITKKTKRSEARKRLVEKRNTETSEQRTIRIQRRTSRRKRRKELRKLRKEETSSERKERLLLEKQYNEELRVMKEMLAKETENEKILRLKRVQEFKKQIKDFVDKDRAEKAARKIFREERKKKNAASRAKRREERAKRKEARAQRRSEVINVNETEQERASKKLQKKQRKEEKKLRKIAKEQRGIDRHVRKVAADNRKCCRGRFRCNNRYNRGGCRNRCGRSYRPRSCRRVCGRGSRVNRGFCIGAGAGLLGGFNALASVFGRGCGGGRGGGRGGGSSNQSGQSGTITNNNVSNTTNNTTTNNTNVYNNIYNYHGQAGNNSSSSGQTGQFSGQTGQSSVKFSQNQQW